MQSCLLLFLFFVEDKVLMDFIEVCILNYIQIFAGFFAWNVLK